MKKHLGVSLFFPFSAHASNAGQLDMAATFGSLLFVIVIIFLLAWALKRMRLPNIMGQDGLKVIRQLPVGTKERLVIVQAGEEQFLVGITSHSINLVSKLDKPLEETQPASVPFGQQLSQLLDKHGKK